MAEELARGMEGFGVAPGSGEPPDRSVVEVVQPPVSEAPAPPAEHQGTVIEMPAPRQQPTAAELLRQEMQAATAPPARPEIVESPVVQAPQPVPPPPPVEPSAAQVPPQAEPSVVSPTLPEAPPPLPAPTAATYTGRIYLMFPSSLSQGRLESVWEVLDQVAGSGKITDTRLISREAGIQFTLDLGDRELDIDALRAKFPDAEVVPMEEDRLRIDWPSD